MAKPSAYPAWATAGTNNVAASGGQIASGWTNGQIPPSSYFNFWQNLVGEWIAYFDQTVNQSLKQHIPPINATVVDLEFPGQVAAPTSYVYALTRHGGSAYLRRGTANNKLQIAPGVLMQLISGTLYSYTFAGTEEYTIANGDVSNPRVDILQMKIDESAGTMAANVTISVKQGTASAIPNYPDPDSGYCVIAGIVVGTGYVAASPLIMGIDSDGANAVIHDQRMPLGLRAVVTTPGQYYYGSSYTLVNNTLVRKTDNTGNFLVAPLWVGYAGRLIGVAASVKNTGEIHGLLGRFAIFNNAGTTDYAFTDLADINSMQTATPSVYTRRHNELLSLQGNMLPDTGPTVLSAISGSGLGAPIWSNGKRCPTEPFRNDASPYGIETIGIRSGGASGDDDLSEWGPTTFYIAGGA